MALADEDALKDLVASDNHKPNEVSYRPLSDRLDEDSTKGFVPSIPEGATKNGFEPLVA